MITMNTMTAMITTETARQARITDRIAALVPGTPLRRKTLGALMHASAYKTRKIADVQARIAAAEAAAKAAAEKKAAVAKAAAEAAEAARVAAETAEAEAVAKAAETDAVEA